MSAIDHQLPAAIKSDDRPVCCVSAQKSSLNVGFFGKLSLTPLTGKPLLSADNRRPSTLLSNDMDIFRAARQLLAANLLHALIEPRFMLPDRQYISCECEYHWRYRAKLLS